MKTNFLFAGGLAGIVLLAGCETIPPGAERGPDGTMAYNVIVESSEPGVKIKVNNEDAGVTPLTLKIFGNPNGTFHDFGSRHYVVQAFPFHTNQFVQTRVFGTGRGSREDFIPHQIFFDMSKIPSAETPAVYERRGYPWYYYYGPDIYVGPPPFGPPGFRFGPPPHGHW